MRYGAHKGSIVMCTILLTLRYSFHFLDDYKARVGHASATLRLLIQQVCANFHRA